MRQDGRPRGPRAGPTSARRAGPARPWHAPGRPRRRLLVGSATWSRSPASLYSPWATSTRKPSTPRSSQNRSTSSNIAATSGLRQSRSGWVVSKRWRYHSPAVDPVHAGPPKTDSQLLGGVAVRAAARRGTGSAPARGCRARRPGPPGTTRARWRCGWGRCRRSPSGPARGRGRAGRRRRRAHRTAGRRRCSRRRRSRGRAGGRCRTG